VVTFHVAKNRVLAMKRLIAATVALAALTGPVFAQASNESDPIIMEQKQKKKDAEAQDRQYKSTLERTRQETTAPRTDPWSNMRGTDDSKTKR
jgi:hypothetical protein